MNKKEEINLVINYSIEKDKEEYTLKYDCTNNDTFLDLYAFIDGELDIKDSDQGCTRFSHIDVQNRKVTPIDNFKVLDFIKYNSLDKNNIKIEYSYLGIGGGEYLNDKLKIEIRAAENNHGENAHIHISNSKGYNQVVFSLITLELLQGNENWRKTFNRKEKKKIKTMLKESQTDFLQFYNTQLNGIVPDTISFKYDKKTYYLSYDNDTH